MVWSALGWVGDSGAGGRHRGQEVGRVGAYAHLGESGGNLTAIRTKSSIPRISILELHRIGTKSKGKHREFFDTEAMGCLDCLGWRHSVGW